MIARTFPARVCDSSDAPLLSASLFRPSLFRPTFFHLSFHLLLPVGYRRAKKENASKHKVGVSTLTLNRQNRNRNFLRSLEVSKQSAKGTTAKGSTDPFSRRATNPINYWNTKKKGKGEEGKEGKGKEGEGKAEPKADHASKQAATGGASALPSGGGPGVGKGGGGEGDALYPEDYMHGGLEFALAIDLSALNGCKEVRQPLVLSHSSAQVRKETTKTYSIGEYLTLQEEAEKQQRQA